MTYPVHYFQKHHKAKVTSPYGPRPDPLGSGKMVMHYGVDLGGVPRGHLWTSPYPGVVTHVGTHGGRGLVVVVKVAGTKTLHLFQHGDKALVKVGDKVVQGTPICTNGTSGEVTGPHLHYEIRWDNGTSLGSPVWGDPAEFTPERAGEEDAMDYYVVKSGDVAWKIAQNHGITLEQIAAWNPQISDLGKIYPGQRIRVKPPASYAASQADLDALAKRVQALEDTLSAVKKALYQD